MGLKDLLLKKGRGVGELKDIRKEHWINAEIIRVIKELDHLDNNADGALKSSDYGKYFAYIRQQINLINKLDHFVHIRLVRAEYAYKDILTVLGNAENDYSDKTTRLRQEIRKASRLKDDAEASAIRQSINKAMHELDNFKDKISQMKNAVQTLRQDLKKQCKHRIKKTRKIYRFA